MDFSIDSHSGVPFYRQIIERVKYGIVRGRLSPGDQLPTVRQLAADLSINLNTVVRAYREMEIEGVLKTQQGSGTFIAHYEPDIGELEMKQKLDQVITEYHQPPENWPWGRIPAVDGTQRWLARARISRSFLSCPVRGSTTPRVDLHYALLYHNNGTIVH